MEITPEGSGIYSIRNNVNNKCYIGSAVNMIQRKRRHYSDLRNNKHHSAKLQRSWDKYGENCFSFIVLEFVENKSDLIACEQKWLDKVWSENIFNTNPTAGSMLGSKQSEETIKKRSLKTKGLKRTQETKDKIVLALKSRDKEVLDKIKASLTGRKLSEEHRLKNVGRKLSAETKLKMSLSRTGKVRSEEAKRKTAESNRGRKASRISVVRNACSQGIVWAIKSNRPFSYLRA